MTVKITFPNEIWINILSQVTDMNDLQSLVRKIPEFKQLTDFFITIISFRPDHTQTPIKKKRDKILSSVYILTFPEEAEDLRVVELVDLKERLDNILKEVRKNKFHRHLVLEFCYKDEQTYRRFQKAYKIISEVFLSRKETPYVSVVEVVDKRECCIP